MAITLLCAYALTLVSDLTQGELDLSHKSLTFVFRLRHGTHATIVIFPRFAYVGFEDDAEAGIISVGEFNGAFAEDAEGSGGS